MERKIRLHTETTIDSCHFLNGYKGNCARKHGHTWFIDVYIQGNSNQLDEVGILFDFGNVKAIKEELDHLTLNDIDYFNTEKEGVNPTAENISMWLYDKLKKQKPELEFKIRLYETKVGKETWCEVGDWF